MRILLNGPVARRGAPLLRERFGDALEVMEILDSDGPDERAAKFGAAEILIAMGFDGKTPACPKLKLLHLPISGLDQLDLDAVPAGTTVCNVYEHEIGIAEYVLSAMLQQVVGLAEKAARFKSLDWSESPRASAPPRGELSGQTVLCLGYGNIGRAVAVRARAFGMRVLAATRSPRRLEPAPDRLVTYAEVSELLPEADFVTVCCPLSEDTEGLIGAAEFARMKRSAMLINVARARIVDEDALFEALSDRRIAGAALDVWYRYPEIGAADPAPSRRPLQKLENVTMTPHLSGWTAGQQSRRWARTMDNIAALLEGRALDNVVRAGAE